MVKNSIEMVVQRPTFVFVLREEHCKGTRLDPLLELLMSFRRGSWRGVKIRLGRLQSFVSDSKPGIAL